jgi:NAD+ kinase
MNNIVVKALIVVNFQKDDARHFVEEVREHLESLDIAVTVADFEGVTAEIPEGNYDIVFSLGGDGTVLYCARQLASRRVPVFAINLGRLGFIAEISKARWKEAFRAYLAGGLSVTQRMMLEVEVERGGVRVVGMRALNDAVISSSGIAKIIDLEVTLPDGSLGAYRADGVIIATPTGSTAYSLAAGGPILAPELDAVVINPICPFTLSNRALVVPADETIAVNIGRAQRSTIILTVDGQEVFGLEPSDTVFVRKAADRALIVSSEERRFLETLRTKLNWSGGPDA